MNTKEKIESPIITYIKQFLDSDRTEIMEHCYFSIRDISCNRYFKDSIDLLDDSNFDSLFPLVSNVILTANKIECDSLNYIISKQNDNDLKKRKHALPIFKNNDIGSPEAYIFKMNSFYILHLNAYETGSNTPGGSTDLVRYISNHPLLCPSNIISFGICYGRDTITQNIGDVIIPKKLYTWSIGQKISDTTLKIKNDNFNLQLEDKFSDSGIYSLLKDFCNNEDGRVVYDTLKLKNTDQSKEIKIDFKIRVTMGNMSTGEAVVSSTKAKKMIRQSTNNEKELGGEMEGFGLAKECILYAKIPCFIIKSICDWGECKDIDKILTQENIKCPPHLKDQLQAYAAFCAGIILFQILNQEKDTLLTLDFIKWMGNSSRKNNRVSRYNYVKKSIIIKNINRYYDINEKAANNIFDTMISNKIIVLSQSRDTFNTNFEMK